MKIPALSCLLFAASTAFAAPSAIEKRTSYNGGLTANDVTDKGMPRLLRTTQEIDLTEPADCTDLTFIFARGSTERGVCPATIFKLTDADFP